MTFFTGWNRKHTIYIHLGLKILKAYAEVHQATIQHILV